MYEEAIKRGSVTGAANWFGKVAATRFAEAALSVVTAEADVRAAAANGVDIIAVSTDVRDADAVANIAEAAFKTGEVAPTNEQHGHRPPALLIVWPDLATGLPNLVC